MIKAAYNFVPIINDYYKPSWHNLVSHDVPFKDGLCGTIELKLTTKTALYINDNGQFINTDGKVFIPGTTIKGAVRSVLEILSFGHLDETRVNDNNFNVRNINSAGLKCGWLIKNSSGSFIINCGSPTRIEYSKVIDLLELTDIDVKGWSRLNVFEKYNHINNVYREGDFNDATSETNSNLNGVLVFSGSFPDKKSEFIFRYPTQNDIESPIKVDEIKYEEYKKIFKSYKINVLSKTFRNKATEEIENLKLEKNEKRKIIQSKVNIKLNETSLPKYFSKRFPQIYDATPVFFTMKDNKVHTLGTTMLHKHSAHTAMAIPPSLRNISNDKQKPDLADIIFGSNKYSLKGRVQFSSAFLENGELYLCDDVVKILSSPRESYWPTYLDKGGAWDDSSRIAGRKRYPIKNYYDTTSVERYDNNGVQKKSVTVLQPIKPGNTFICHLSFHNLREIELGALLSAITFHGNIECKHSIGQAKAYGYGSVEFEIKSDAGFIPDISPNSDGLEILTIKGYIDKFEDTLRAETTFLNNGTSLNNHSSIKELIAMAKGIDKVSSPIFTSMTIAGKEFANAKKDNEYLRRFTEVITDNPNLYQTHSPKNKGNQTKSTKFETRGWQMISNTEYKGFVTDKGVLLVYPLQQDGCEELRFYSNQVISNIDLNTIKGHKVRLKWLSNNNDKNKITIIKHWLKI